MEQLLDPEVIRAAASSTLGILSLMCLIVGIVALTFFRNAPVWARLLVFTLFFVGVSGFGYAVLNQQSLSPNLEATRQFFIGRWEVQQPIFDMATATSMDGATYMDYFHDGTFSGTAEIFRGEVGTRQQISGRWDFSKLATDKFRLTLSYDNGHQWQGIFRILAQDRIHNIGHNYDAVRVPR